MEPIFNKSQLFNKNCEVKIVNMPNIDNKKLGRSTVEDIKKQMLKARENKIDINHSKDAREIDNNMKINLELMRKMNNKDFK